MPKSSDVIAVSLPAAQGGEGLVEPVFTTAEPIVRVTRAVALGCVLALIALGLAWELWLAPTGRGTLALKVLPLLLPIGGLMRYRMFTYRWLSLLVWVYFVEGVVRATSDAGLSRWLAGAEVTLSVVLFVACAAHVRRRFKQVQPILAAAPGSASSPAHG